MTKLNYSIEERLNRTVIANKSNIKVVNKEFEGQVGKETTAEAEIEL